VLTTTPQHHAGAPARTRHLAVLLVAAFAGPWLVWGSAIAQGHGLIGWRIPQGVALWTMTPSLALALLAIGGRAAVRDLAARLVRVRRSARWALLALATPVVLATAAAGLGDILGEPSELGRVMGLPASLLYLVYGTGLFLLTEEATWRGALLPRLQARLAPLTANLLLGGVWAVWHVPLLLVPGADDEGLPLLPFAVLVVGTAVLIGALTNAARGSVLVAAVFHASFDAAYSYAGVVGTHHVVLWASAGLTAVAATAVAVRTRGRLASS
jgi:membrane protease YdiL (CAAX protease family)